MNWRRRKVCQTCYPCERPPFPRCLCIRKWTFRDCADAEGNGDSISAAVQAERIALLSSVLVSQVQQQQQTQAAAPPPFRDVAPAPAPQRQGRLPARTVPQVLHTAIPRHASSLDSYQPLAPHAVPRAYAPLDSPPYDDAQPIYQTSSRRQTSPLARSPLTPPQSAGFPPTPAQAQAPLLPAFLQDIVQSPSLSPTSTCSADLSADADEFDSSHASIYSTQVHDYSEANGRGRALPASASASAASLVGNAGGGANIWRLDGEESKVLGGMGVPPYQEEFVRAKRMGSREGMRA